MEILPLMILVSLLLGFCGLVAFLWSILKGQFDDPQKCCSLALEDEDQERIKELVKKF